MLSVISHYAGSDDDIIIVGPFCSLSSYGNCYECAMS